MGYTIRKAAELTGVTAHVLRIWQQRYGWPQPDVFANGYRCFTDDHVELIKRFAKLLRQGYKHQELIRDGVVVWPDTRPRPCFDRLRAVVCPSDRKPARAALEAIRSAIMTRNGRALMQHLVEVVCLVHPLDRIGAGWLPALHGLVAWESSGRPMPRAGEAWRFILDQIGAATLARLMREVRP